MCTPNALARTLPRVVAHRIHLEQRSVHLQVHRDRLPPRRLQRLRMGSRAARRPKLPSTRFLERCRPFASHHVERTSSGPTRHRVISTPAQGKARRPTRNNTAVVAALTKLTTRSAVVMTEMRRLWYLLDTNDIHIRPPYIHLAANIWADTPCCEQDTEDLQLNPRMFAHHQARWGPHSIDRFASMLNTQIPRFNARWRDPQCKHVDCLRLPDAAWQCKNSSCNPP
jgi:hypothetical protein